MHIVYHAESLIDAQLVKNALEQVEIPAFLAGEFFTGVVGQLATRGFLTVMVPEAAAEAAEAIVRVIEGQLAEARAAAASDDDFGAATLPA